MTTSWLRNAVLLLLVTGCAATTDANDDDSASTEEALTAGLHASETAGGFKHLTWNGGELTTGGGFYVIASCSGKDDQYSNIDSGRGTGVLTTPDGHAPSCAAPHYSIHFSGSNPITATINVGPLPAKLGALVFSLDLEKALFPDFAWDGTTKGWEEGCANDYKPVLNRTSGVVSAIRSPCKIPGVGNVGLAERPLVAGVGAMLEGGPARVDLHIDSVEVTDSANKALALPGTFTITNHPGTNALGAGFSNVPVGATMHITAKIGVSNPPARALPCGHLTSGETMNRGDSVSSCDGRFQLVHQTDGNVVLYRKSDSHALWQTGTSGKPTTRFTMQTDGNLVLYGVGALWQSGTVGHPGAALSIQNDGNVVIYPKSGSFLWQTNTD